MYYLPKDFIQLQWAEEQGESSMKMCKKVIGMKRKSKGLPENCIETPEGDRDEE